ncbi:hypothetical protein HYH03_013096 [Edaphochlamys debaryana]|uniref:F-box domain-containing protein n=1 Tax=Edaphochlamys debaryana TaxID=47281 RepID=A0A836BTT3_9CHLO|nr:hypothetical protein HYH03_013096 [Edaphochlamys debaryana]|eukprot:KAG2488412.1 hypothetical protein HYH03_013096 [Edaphochlamys debaryana]
MVAVRSGDAAALPAALAQAGVAGEVQRPVPDMATAADASMPAPQAPRAEAAGADDTRLASEAIPDWALLPRDPLDLVLRCLDSRSLLAALQACSAWGGVAARLLGRRRREAALASWASVLQQTPRLSRALAQVDLADLTQLARQESPPRPIVQLFHALELLWTRYDRKRDREQEAALQRRRGGAPAAAAQARAKDDNEEAEEKARAVDQRLGDLEDPALRRDVWAKAQRRMQIPDFPDPCLIGALPLSPAALALLRRRMGLTAAGGGWEPGPRLPPLVPGEVAAHSPAAGRLAEWLVGTEELVRAGQEKDAADAWAWPKQLLKLCTRKARGSRPHRSRR